MTLPPYQYNGARSMVILHEQELRLFVVIWKEAKASGIPLPPGGYPNYDYILQHVLACARSYMVWMCERLGLPDPGIPAAPPPEVIEAQADQYLEAVLDGWREPLKDVPEDRFDEVYKSRWNIDYCIDSMLEHAVMHPIRHSFQIENWIAK